jgi:hypothetical protein
MKFEQWIGCAAMAACSFALQGSVLAQSQSQTGREQLLFSRSASQNPAPAAAPTAAAASQPGPQATNAERQALTFTSYDLNVHLVPRNLALAVEARMTVRNDGQQPLTRIALQISSALSFETVATEGKKLAFVQQTLNSDVDHTGQLHEAVVTLAAPLAPGATLPVEAAYSGTVPVSAKRLTAIGAPGDTAEASDWDRVSEDFVGLRGFGNVVWYPVSSVPVALGDGNKVFEEIGRQELRESGATVTLHVTEEFTDQPPNVAILDGHAVTATPAATPTGAFPGVIEFSQGPAKLGFATPSLFLARETVDAEGGVDVYTKTLDAGNAQAYLTAASTVQSLLHDWLGTHPRAALTVVDLPDSDDASAEAGAALLTPVTAASPEALTTGMVHALAHAYFWSPRAWLNDGVPEFLVTLWLEQTKGKTAALEHLESGRDALSLAEPASPGEGEGEPLIEAHDAVYSRTKAAYVLGMLRTLTGDPALEKALQAYDPAKDTQPDYFEHLLEKSSGKDLRWFFDNWVYQDRGLPDLEITHVYPSQANLGETLVAIDITNHGYAEVNVPVTLHSTSTSVTDHVRVPAHGVITHRMEIQGHPTEVDVNDGSVPEVSDSIHATTLQ